MPDGVDNQAGSGAPASQSGSAQPPAAPAPATPPPPHLPNPNPPQPPAAGTKYTLNIPDGSMLNPSALQRIEAYARERGLSNEDAQRVVNIESGAVADFYNQSKDALKSSVEAWKKEWAEDAEIGGEKHKDSLDAIKKVLTDYATPDFAKFVEDTGFIHNVEFGRLIYRLFKATGAGNGVVFPGSNSGSTQKKAPWEIIYDKTPANQSA